MDCGTNLPEDSVRARRCDECQSKNICPVENCGRPSAGWGMCKKHWKRWKKYGDPLGSSDYKQVKRKCSVDGCERPYHSHGYCGRHGYYAKKYGDPLAEGVGQYTGRHRMEVPSYAGIHKRIFYDRGRAKAHQCVDCSRRADEWSYDGGAPDEIWEKVRGVFLAYTTDQSFYSPRCKRCHRAKDLVNEAQADRAKRLGSFIS